MAARQQPKQDGPVYLDENHQAISEFAERFVKEDGREDFVAYHMGELGYEPVTSVSWKPPAPPEPDSEPDPGQPGGGGQPARGPYFKRR